MSHKYKVGQSVMVVPPNMQSGQVYEIVRLMPETVQGDPQYRVKTANGVERMVREQEIKAA
jgi:hypothetical protein